MNKKHTIEFIRDQFFKRAKYIVLSNKYINAHSKLNILCDKNHKVQMTWNSFSKEHRCLECSGKRKYTIEEVRKSFSKENYILLSKTYKNKRSKLKYICPNNHKNSTTYGKWNYGRRCPDCYNLVRGIDKKLDIEYIKSEFEKEGYKLLTKKYNNSAQILDCICNNNHKITTTWSNFQQGRRCKKCYNNRRGNTLKLNFDIIKKSFEKEGYKLLTKKYINSKQLLSYICPENHKGKTNWNNWSDKDARCHKCFSTNSNAENELFEIIKSKIPSAKQNDRTLIYPLELDTIIHSKKTAIEYCGLYWHSEQNGKDKKYHLNKLDLCNKKEYNLITIFEDEWLNKKDIVLSRLFNILGISESDKIYARKCVIKEIDPRLKNEFLNANHIQGTDRSKIKLGAFYNNKLVSVMTFSKLSISKGNHPKEGIWELNRFCSDINIRIIGIASKLFKYFTNNYDFKEVITYGDRRWSKGNLYKKLGFSFVHNSQPNYWYIQEGNPDHKRYHRFNFRKNVLKAKLEDFNPNITEIENMKNNGYFRIFDCGNTKWVYKNKGVRK